MPGKPKLSKKNPFTYIYSWKTDNSNVKAPLIDAIVAGVIPPDIVREIYKNFGSTTEVNFRGKTTTLEAELLKAELYHLLPNQGIEEFRDHEWYDVIELIDDETESNVKTSGDCTLNSDTTTLIN